MNGVLLGKFLPPHRAHELLIDVARRDQAARGGSLTVLVCGTGADPIPPGLRALWISETFPDVRVTVLDAPVQQAPDPAAPAADTPFWDMWHRLLRAAVGGPVEVVYAGEDYGARLAADLGAEFFLVDRHGQVMADSGTSLRAGVLGSFDRLLPAARGDVVVKVAIVGPESCGKSTGAAALARRFATRHVPEHARDVLELHDYDERLELFDQFVRGQRALAAAAAAQANRLLVCDTDELTTLLWARALHAASPAPIVAAVDALSAPRFFDHHLLFDTDLPFVQDGTRAPDGVRRHTTADFAAELETRGLPYTVVRGTGEARTDAAAEVVERLLTERDRPLAFPADEPVDWAQRAWLRASQDPARAEARARVRSVVMPTDALVFDPALARRVPAAWNAPEPGETGVAPTSTRSTPHHQQGAGEGI